MASDEEIRERLKELTAAPIQVRPALVSSVDEDELTCVIEPVGEAEISGVRLKAAIREAGSYVVSIPKAESVVLYGILENDRNTAFIVLCDEIDKFIVAIGSMRFEINAEGSAFNDGLNGGLTKVQGVLNSLNAIEQKINDLVNIFTSWSPASGDGGAALKALLATWTALQQTQINALENEDVKH